MKRFLSFAVKAFCIFAVMFSLATTSCFSSNKGGNGNNGGDDGSNGGGSGTSQTRPNGNTIPPIILRPR